jgi:DNA polymerase III delta prime subunit
MKLGDFLYMEGALPRFVGNLKRVGKSLDRIDRILDTDVKNSILFPHFIWSESPEGHDYWINLENKLGDAKLGKYKKLKTRIKSGETLLEPTDKTEKTKKEQIMSTSELATSIEKQINKAIEEAVANGRSTVETLVMETKEQLKDIGSKKPILSVKVNGEKRKLKSRAVPYLDRLIINAKLGLNTLLVGPAGCGKTTAARQVADSLGLDFGSICLTAGASETWLFGRQTPSGFKEGAFSKLYREGGVFLADEMDAADANLMLSINTALANGVLFNPMNGESYERHEDFIFIGAANTFGKGGNHVYTGRSRLDGATLDRFVSIEVDYDKEIEKELCPTVTIRKFLNVVRRKFRDNGYPEVVSTRQFDSFYKMYKAGVSLTEIKNSFKANMSEPAQKIVDEQFSSKLSGVIKEVHKETVEVEHDTI